MISKKMATFAGLDIHDSVFQAEQERGVIAASAGNHALALSYHGKLLRVPVTVVMPIVAPLMKVSACKQYGANVIVTGQDIGDVSMQRYFLCASLVIGQ